MKAKNQKVNQMNKEEHILSTDKPECLFFRASTADFKKIPGSPIAYWLNEGFFCIFENASFESKYDCKQGLASGDNDRFFRFYWEVSFCKCGFAYKQMDLGLKDGKKWYPLNKGGDFRKWFGNREYLIAFDQENRDALKLMGNHLPSESYYLKPTVSWSDITSALSSFRFFEDGFLFNNKGNCIFFEKDEDRNALLSYSNSKPFHTILKSVNPTLTLSVGALAILPGPSKEAYLERDIVNKCIENGKVDWDSYETSWDFTNLLLLHLDYRQSTLKATYNNLRSNWQEMTLEMQRLEEENNRIFIDAYGLQEELTPEVPLNEITLTCNPHYRYSNSKNAEELDALLLADTIKEFISYAVGCMFGRYALDKPGLILANQGDTITEYLRQIPDPTFQADEDNVIPILDGDWFTDDISERFRKFLRITFGEEHYEENLKFIEVALGKEIRKYFLKDFYNDHLRRYKKRPIYWLFSSPKGSFNALIYMHRYRPDTASVVLNGYLREFRTKLLSRKSQLEAVSISASASPGEKTKALKEIESLRKMIEELESYERDVLYPLATEQIAINLDDGVKVNYQKFGPALKKIPGLDAKEE